MTESTTPESLPPAGKPAFNHPYALFQNKDYVRFLTGRLVSTFGQQMLAVFLGKEIWDRTHSAMALALVGLTQFVPMLLFTLPAGHVADQHNRKNIIFLTTLIVAATNIGLVFISAFQAPVESGLHLPLHFRFGAHFYGPPPRPSCRNWWTAKIFQSCHLQCQRLPDRHHSRPDDGWFSCR